MVVTTFPEKKNPASSSKVGAKTQIMSADKVNEDMCLSMPSKKDFLSKINKRERLLLDDIYNLHVNFQEI